MKILYVCKANIGRSQMAETYHKLISPEDIVNSAGIYVYERAGLKLREINSAKKVIEVIEEIISVEKLKTLFLESELTQISEAMIQNNEKIIVMASKTIWPNYLIGSEKVEYWPIDDPKGADKDKHRKIRDQITGNIEKMLKGL